MFPQYLTFVFVNILVPMQGVLSESTSVTWMCRNMLEQLWCGGYLRGEVPAKCQVLLHSCADGFNSSCWSAQKEHDTSAAGIDNSTVPSHKLLILTTNNHLRSKSWLYDVQSKLISPFTSFPPAIQSYLYIHTDGNILISTNRNLMLFELSKLRFLTIHENVVTKYFGFDERRGIVFFFRNAGTRNQLFKMLTKDNRIAVVRSVRASTSFSSFAVSSSEELLYITCRSFKTLILIYNYKGIFHDYLGNKQRGTILSSFLEGNFFYFKNDDHLYKWAQDKGSQMIIVTDRNLKEVVILNSTLYTTSYSEGQVSVLDPERRSFTELRLRVEHNNIGILAIT